MRLILIAVCCFGLVILPVFAQSDRGTITGAVSDPAGAVIPNAAIEAKNSETGALYQTTSSATGNYTLFNRIDSPILLFTIGMTRKYTLTPSAK